MCTKELVSSTAVVHVTPLSPSCLHRYFHSVWWTQVRSYSDLSRMNLLVTTLLVSQLYVYTFEKRPLWVRPNEWLQINFATAWYIRHVRWACLFYISFIIWFLLSKPTIWLLILSFTIKSFARVLYFILMEDIGRWLPWMLPGSTGRFSITTLQAVHWYYYVCCSQRDANFDHPSNSKTRDMWIPGLPPHYKQLQDNPRSVNPFRLDARYQPTSVCIPHQSTHRTRENLPRPSAPHPTQITNTG